LPSTINYLFGAEGWIIEIKPEDASQLEAILNKEAYLKMLEGLE